MENLVFMLDYNQYSFGQNMNFLSARKEKNIGQAKKSKQFYDLWQKLTACILYF